MPDIIDFLDEVKKTQSNAESMNKLKENINTKRRTLASVKTGAVNNCLGTVFTNTYKNALPLDNNYKSIHDYDLEKDAQSYIGVKAPKGLEYYIHESIKKGNKPAKLLFESVNDLVNKHFLEMELNLDAVPSDDIVFNPEDDDIKDGIGHITDKMGLDSISEVIKDNVKQSALNDITKTKEHDEELKNLVEELKNDPTVTSEAALDRRLQLIGFNEQKMYKPSLFEGIMVNKSTLIKESGLDIDEDDIMKKAFVESVKEYTLIETFSKLGAFPVSPYDVSPLAIRYSQMDVPESTISVYEAVEEAVDAADTFEVLTEDPNLGLDDDLMLEGTNWDVRRAFVEKRKEIKKTVRNIKKLYREKKYSECKKEATKLKSILQNVYDEIDKINEADNSALSMVVSLFTGDIMFIGRNLLSLFIPFGRLVVEVVKIKKRIEVIMADTRKHNRDKAKVGDFNLYVNGIKVRLKEYMDICDKYITLLENTKDGEEPPKPTAEEKGVKKNKK